MGGCQLVHKITLMDAYVIETIRSKGISNEEIISKTKNEAVTDFEKFHDSFDFTILYELFSRGVLEEVLENGYKVTFLTFPGLINLLKLKFEKVENIDFIVNEYMISKLILNKKEEQDLRTFLSVNWLIEQREDGFIIMPVGNK